MLMCEVLYKAEATWRLGVLVESHDDALDGAHDGQSLVDLQLGGVEAEVAYVDSGGAV